VNRRFVKQGEERQADFVNIVAWSKTGEFCSKYFKKGQQVGVIGRIQTRNCEDENKVIHYATEVVAEEAYFADSKRDPDASNFANTFGNEVSGNSEFEVTSGDELPF
jgi:single-strand DNA-binding protein